MRMVVSYPDDLRWWVLLYKKRVEEAIQGRVIGGAKELDFEVPFGAAKGTLPTWTGCQPEAACKIDSSNLSCVEGQGGPPRHGKRPAPCEAPEGLW